MSNSDPIVPDEDAAPDPTPSTTSADTPPAPASESTPSAEKTPVIGTKRPAPSDSPSNKKKKAKNKEGSMENFIKAAMDATKYLTDLGAEIEGDLKEWIKDDPGGLRDWVKNKAEEVKEKIPTPQEIADNIKNRAQEFKDAFAARPQPGQDQTPEGPEDNPSEARVRSLSEPAAPSPAPESAATASALASLDDARRASAGITPLPGRPGPVLDSASGNADDRRPEVRPEQDDTDRPDGPAASSMS